MKSQDTYHTQTSELRYPWRRVRRRSGVGWRWWRRCTTSRWRVQRSRVAADP